MRRRTILLVVSLVGALALVSVAFASKPAKPPKPHHGKGQGHHHMYAWHDVATGTTAHFRGLAALSANKAWVSRLHGDRRRRLPHARPRRDLAGRQPGGHSLDAPVPRHRGVRRQPRGRHVVGNRSGLADLPHRRRRPDLDARLPEHRAERVLRLHDVLQPQGRPGRLRSAGRTEVPDHQDDGRGPHLEHRRSGRDASCAAGRGRLRS